MTVDDYIANKEGQERKILRHLHHFFSEEAGLRAEIRHKIPFYYERSWVCYLNVLKKGGVELVFIKGQRLSNEDGWLDGRDRKMVAGVIFTDLSDIDEERLMETLQEALIIDEMDQSKDGR